MDLVAPCLMGFVATRLPPSDSFVAVIAQEYCSCRMSGVARRNHVKTEKTGQSMFLSDNPVRKVELNCFGVARAAKPYLLTLIFFLSQQPKSLYGLWFRNNRVWTAP